METLLNNINDWHWLILGFSLIVVELFIWSAYCLWLGVVAITIAILINLYPGFTLNHQLFSFIVFSVLAIFVSKKVLPVKTMDDKLEKSAKKHIGKIASVVELSNEIATIKIGKSLWQAQGCEMQTGQNVEVIDAEGLILIVRPSS